MGPSHSLSSIDSGDAILGPGRLLLRLWEAAGYGTLPLAWPGPQTKLVSQILLLRNLDFRHSCPRLFLMVLDWVMESYGLSFSTVSRNAEKTRLQRKPVCREREMWGEKRGGREEGRERGKKEGRKEAKERGLPVQVGCMRQVLGAGALGWPRGMGWEGRWVQDGEHMEIHGWFMSMYGKNHYNIVK